MGKRKGKVKQKKTLPPITVANIGDFKVIRRRADQSALLEPLNCDHKFSLIWLHDLGDTGQDYEEYFTDKQKIEVPAGCKVILPTAPNRQVTVKKDQTERCWFDIFSILPLHSTKPLTAEFIKATYNQEHILEAVGYVETLIKKEVALLGSAQKVFLAGFS
jgi:hypothetical protein